MEKRYDLTNITSTELSVLMFNAYNEYAAESDELVLEFAWVQLLSKNNDCFHFRKSAVTTIEGDENITVSLNNGIVVKIKKPLAPGNYDIYSTILNGSDFGRVKCDSFEVIYA